MDGKYSLIKVDENLNRTLEAKDSSSDLGAMSVSLYRVKGVVRECLYWGTFDNNGEWLKKGNYATNFPVLRDVEKD